MDSKRAGRPRFRWAAAGPGWASRRRAKRTISNQAPAVWRPPQGLRGLASVPVGGGRARADYPAALSSARLEAAAGPAGQAAVPVAGGRAWAGSETTHRATRQRPCTTGLEGTGGRRQGQGGLSDRTKHRPVGGSRGACRAWPGFETTRRAKLAARTASGRAGPAAAGDQAVPQAPPESQNSS